MKKQLKVYICGTDFQHHLGPGGDVDGVEIFNTLADLKRKKPCWKECGVVELEIKPLAYVVAEKTSFKKSRR